MVLNMRITQVEPDDRKRKGLSIRPQLVSLFVFSLCSLIVCGMAQTGDTGALSLKTKLEATATVANFLDPADPHWASAPETPVKLSRTPPLYVGDPTDDGQRPSASVRLVRLLDDSVIFRAHWTDATEDRPTSGTSYPQGGGQPHIYKIHSDATNAFPDAFCVMAPKQRGAHTNFPSLMMGDTVHPVDLYYWRANAGFQKLDAHGRQSTAAASEILHGSARRDGNGWTLTVAVPKLEVHTPVCFAIWDGTRQQRDGLKFFSIWYEVE